MRSQTSLRPSACAEASGSTVPVIIDICVVDFVARQNWAKSAKTISDAGVNGPPGLKTARYARLRVAMKFRIFSKIF